MSSGSSRTSTVLTVAAVTVLGGLVAYAVYFDHKRRNDTEFRKKLRKDKKKVSKQQQQQQEQTTGDAAAVISAAEIKAALLKLRQEDLPPTPDEKESYFMMQVQVGDQLVHKGPAFYLPAAMAFFRALRVYPSPVEFIMMLQQTLPEPIFKLFMELVNADVASHIEGYYDHFPPRKMHVSVQHKGTGDGPQATKKILVAEKDFAVGDVIYTEFPVVSALDADLEAQGTHCSYCFRSLPETDTTPIVSENHKLASVFCSKECQVKANYSWLNMYFGSDPLLPPEIAEQGGMDMLPQEPRSAAQDAYVQWQQTKAKRANVLAARFSAKLIALETQKLIQNNAGPLATELAALDDDGKATYSIQDHVERLRFTEGNVTDEEVKLIRGVFGSALAGLEQTILEDKHAILVGKMAYNAIGVTPHGGREDKPAPTERPEDQEWTRTPHGTARQVGIGLYLVSSYLAHSCDPSARPSFDAGTNALSLIAARPLAKGDELTIAWVDVSQHADESAEAARRRRRVALARGWKFRCECERCVGEVVQEIAREDEDKELGVSSDESRVEAVMRHERAPGADMTPD